jgi:hypothetical protein
MTIETDLASLEVASDLNRASLSRFSTALTTEEYQAGDVLMRQGELGTSFLIVLGVQITASCAGQEAAW